MLDYFKLLSKIDYQNTHIVIYEDNTEVEEYYLVALYKMINHLDIKLIYESNRYMSRLGGCIYKSDNYNDPIIVLNEDLYSNKFIHLRVLNHELIHVIFDRLFINLREVNTHLLEALVEYVNWRLLTEIFNINIKYSCRRFVQVHLYHISNENKLTFNKLANSLYSDVLSVYKEFFELDRRCQDV